MNDWKPIFGRRSSAATTLRSASKPTRHAAATAAALARKRRRLPTAAARATDAAAAASSAGLLSWALASRSSAHCPATGTAHTRSAAARAAASSRSCASDAGTAPWQTSTVSSCAAARSASVRASPKRHSLSCQRSSCPSREPSARRTCGCGVHGWANGRTCGIYGRTRRNYGETWRWLGRPLAERPRGLSVESELRGLSSRVWRAAPSLQAQAAETVVASDGWRRARTPL